MNPIKSIFAAIAFVLLAAVCAGAAHAEPTPPAQQPAATKSGSFFMNLDGSIREFSKKTTNGLAESMKTFAYGIAAKTTEPALKVGGGLAFMYLMYEVLQFLSGRTRSMLTVLFDVGVPCIIAALLIQSYAERLGQFESLLDLFRKLGGDNPIAGIMDMYGGVMKSISTAIQSGFNELTTPWGAMMDPGKMAASVVDLLITLLFSLVILFLVLSGIAEILGLLLMGPFLFAVGVAFGPLLIAGIVTPWTRDYFTKWVQFIVISAALTGVVGVILSIAGSMMSSLGMVTYTNGQPTAVSMIILTVLLMSVNAMISQAPGITNALLPGHLGVAKGAGGALQQAVKGASGPGKQGVGKVASSVGGTAGKTVRMSKAALQKIYPKKS